MSFSLVVTMLEEEVVHIKISRFCCSVIVKPCLDDYLTTNTLTTCLEKNGEIKFLLKVLKKPYFILETILHIESTTQKYIEFQTCTRCKQIK
jgi:hypothetical protein